MKKIAAIIAYISFALLGFFSGVVCVFAATTIGNNISTGGTISASGTITAGSDINTTGNIAASGTLTVTAGLRFIAGSNNNFILSSDSSGNATWVPVSSALSHSDTDSLSEGSTNLYYTNGRVDTEVASQTGIANGIAPLDGSSTVPLSNLPVGVPGGLATLDSNGLVFASQLPQIVISNTYVVGSQAAMLALSANVGDIAIRTDLNQSFILQSTPPSTLSNWIELLSSSTSVISWNGRTGNVTPQSGDYTKSQITGLADADSPTFAGLTLTTGSVNINGVNYTFPSATGSAGTVLTTDASGTLSWSSSLANAVTSLNGLTTSTQTFATGSAGTDFNVSSTGTTHTFNIPNSSSSTRGLLTSTDFNTFNNKLSATTASSTYVTYTYASSTYAQGTGTAKRLTYWSGTNTVSLVQSGGPGLFLTPSSTSATGFDWISAASSGVTVSWGSILGTLSDQTDLQGALDAKLSTTTAAATYVPYTGASSSVDLGANGLTLDTVQFNASNSASDGVGVLRWNDTDGTLNLGLKGGNVSLQIGEELVLRVLNNTGSTINDGELVYVSGSSGGFPTIALAKADNFATAATTFGMVTESIANGAEGFVTVGGLVHDLDTSAFNEGDVLWLSASTAGAFTNIPPSAPNTPVRIGAVIVKSAVSGVVAVKIQPGFNLGNISNVSAASPSDGDVLMYEASSSLWKNATITGYVSLAYASSSFVSFPYASSTFPTFDYASSSFVSFDYASSTFVSFPYASSTFPTFDYASSSFVSFPYASSTFPSFAYASSTYAQGTGLLKQVAYWSGTNTVSYIPTGLPGQFLRASSTSPTGFDWSATSAAAVSWGTITGLLSDQADLQAALNAKLSTTSAAATYVAGAGTGATNTLAYWTSPSAVATLAAGANGTFLRASSTSATGFDWIAGNSGTVTSIDVSGNSTGLTFTGGPVSTSGTITLGGVLAIANGGTGATTSAAAFAALSPLTTKGDILTYNTGNTRLPVGSNGQVLTASSTAATGLAWTTASAGTVSSVDASGGTTGLSFTGGPITATGTLTLTGTLNVANGGTGATTSSPYTVFGNMNNTSGAPAFGTMTSINNQTGAGYTIVNGDYGKLVTLSNASAQNVTLPSTAPASGWFVYIKNRGAGTWTVQHTPTIDGSASTIIIYTGQGIGVWSDGSNYFTSNAPAAINDTNLSSGQLIVGDGKGNINVANLTGDVTTGGTTQTTVAKVNGVSYSSSPATNTVPVVTSGGAGGSITYETVPLLAGGTGQTTATAAFDALSPLSATGSLIAWNGTHNAAFTAGSAGQVLTVSSTAATGLAWTSAAASGVGTTSPFTSGYLPYATSSLTLTNSPVFTDGNSVAIGTTTFGSTGNIPLTIAASGGTFDALDVYNTNEGGKNAFSLFTDLSTSTNTGKAFNIQVPGEALARVQFYSDGKFGIGPGIATRDIYLSRSATNTFIISSDGSTGAGNLRLTGAFFDSTNASGTSGQVLQSTGTSTRWVSGSSGTVTSVDASTTVGLTFTGGPITTSGTLTLSGGTLNAANGGTGQSSYTIGDLLYASAATTLSKLADVTAGSYLRSGGAATAPVWSTVTLPNTAAQGDIWYGSAANAISALAKNTTATRYLANTGTNNNPAWDQVNLANGVTGRLPFANLTQGSARSVLGVTGNATADVASIQGTANQVLVVNTGGTALAFGQVNLASASAVTGALAIGNGGTGQTTATAAFNALSPLTTKGDILANDGTNDVRVAVGSNGQFLTASSGAASGVAWASGSDNGTVLDWGIGGNSSFTMSCNSGGNPNYIFKDLGTTFESGDNVGAQMIMPHAYTLQNMYVKIGNATVPSGETATFYLRNNGATTTLTCAIGAGASTCHDTTHTVSVAAGDGLNLKVWCSGGATGIAGPFSISVQGI